MLVLESGLGVTAHTIGPDGCVNSTKTVQQNIRYNHGLSLCPDGEKMYVSSETNVWEFDYDAASMTATNQKTVVQGMSTGIHNTRTVHVVPNKPNFIVVSVGSNANFDTNAGNMRATVRVFDMNNVPNGGWQYNTQGHQLGWGLRNEVALAFDPNGHVWGSENSGDVRYLIHEPNVVTTDTRVELPENLQRPKLRHPHRQPRGGAQLP
jgi:glucose/arabinose dehydrogenase